MSNAAVHGAKNMCGGDGVLFEFSSGDAVLVNFFVLLRCSEPHMSSSHTMTRPLSLSVMLYHQ